MLYCRRIELAIICSFRLPALAGRNRKNPLSRELCLAPEPLSAGKWTKWEFPPFAIVFPVFALNLQESELRDSAHRSLFTAHCSPVFGLYLQELDWQLPAL
jgi:hypothetical protein